MKICTFIFTAVCGTVLRTARLVLLLSTLVLAFALIPTGAFSQLVVGVASTSDDTLPHLSVYPDTLDFGDVQVGNQFTWYMDIAHNTDTISRDMHIKMVSTDLAFTFAKDLDPDYSSWRDDVSYPAFALHEDSVCLLGPYSGRTIFITFAPLDTGRRIGYITFIHDGYHSPASIVVIGRGTRIPEDARLFTPILHEGWNMVSLPGVAVPATPQNRSRLYVNPISYSGHYVPNKWALPGVGYWYNWSSTRLLPVIAVFSTSVETVAVKRGWNMIGGPGVTVSVSQIVSDVPGMQLSLFYEYDGVRYVPSDSIRPTVGYWVKASQLGNFIIAPLGKLAKLNIVQYVDDGEQPPPPPGGFVSPTPEPKPKPTSYALSQNYPNPCNPSTTITYDLPAGGMVTLTVYNLWGQKVARLVSEQQAAGTYTVEWNADNVASGVYFYQLRTGKTVISKKLTILK